MDTLARKRPFDEEQLMRPAYDSNNLHPLDEEDRKHDDATTDIDWDEIIASTQDDELAGRYCFTTEHYPTHEAGMAALRQWLHRTIQGALNEKAGTLANDGAG